MKVGVEVGEAGEPPEGVQAAAVWEIVAVLGGQI